MISEIDFECNIHCYEVDFVSAAVKECMIDNQNVLINYNISGDAEIEVKSKLEFINCWDESVPTTCCYQCLIPYELS